MAVVNLKSAQITTQDTGAAANGFIAGGLARTEVDVVALANGDSIASTYRILRLPSNARISSLSLFCTAITSGAADVGIYQTTANGGAVVDADAFIAAQSIATASPGLNVIGGNTLAPASRTKRLWEALGLTADPQRDYDVVLTLTAATTAAGTAGLECVYTV